MAVLHPATIAPTKTEVLIGWLGRGTEVVGSYRYDDPAGEVGVEAFVVRRRRALLHAVLTYRGAPLDTATQVAVIEHSELGTRWVYDGTTDPVALGCFERAIRGQQDQATLEVWKDGVLLEVREPTVRVSVEPGGGSVLVIVCEVSDGSSDGARLVASWDGGKADVARLV